MATAEPPSLLVEDLRVVRGGREVLHGLDFAVAPGEVVGLLGPSGGGKSTLIRALVGVQKRVTGRCEVLGLPAGHRELRRRLAYLAQSPAVYFDLTVAENLRYFAAVLGVEGDRADEVIELVGLGQAARQVVRSLSGGQQRRVSLAITLLSNPDVLILDEPTVGLDPVLRRDLWDQFRALAAAGTALLVSSHVMEEAAECDRLLLLRDGDLLADDTEAALLERTGASDVTDAFLRLVDGDAA